MSLPSSKSVTASPRSSTTELSSRSTRSVCRCRERWALVRRPRGHEEAHGRGHRHPRRRRSRRPLVHLRPPTEERGRTRPAQRDRGTNKDLEVNTLVDAAVRLTNDPAQVSGGAGRGLHPDRPRGPVEHRPARAGERGGHCVRVDSWEHRSADRGGRKGFDPESVTRGHGLTNIEERADELGGG